MTTSLSELATALTAYTVKQRHVILVHYKTAGVAKPVESYLSFVTVPDKLIGLVTGLLKKIWSRAENLPGAVSLTPADGLVIDSDYYNGSLRDVVDTFASETDWLRILPKDIARPVAFVPKNSSVVKLHNSRSIEYLDLTGLTVLEWFS